MRAHASSPRLVIIGFPNVGKSTLFNRLLGRRKALIHSLPGMTRDIVSAPGVIEGKPCLLVDTGGIFGAADEPLSAEVREKAWEAAREADAILFMLDGKRGAAPAEEELYRDLKKLGKPLFLVVNKIDGPGREHEAAEFHRLGEERVFAISAEHKFNMDALIDAVAAILPEADSQTATPAEASALRLAVIGRINVGKSSLINRLCGEDRLLVSEVPGTTRDSTDTLISRNGRMFWLVDTAGIRKFAGTRDDREKAGILRAKRNIRDADVLVLVLDATEFPTRQDAHIAHLAAESGKPLVLALNKWDLVDKTPVRPADVRTHVHSRLEFVSYAPVLLVSAKSGQRVVKILDEALKARASSEIRVDTARLNRFLSRVAEAHPPRSKSGAPMKIKYMTQADILPPTFILSARGRGSLAPAYEKFFLARIREEFGFSGTPLRLFLKKR
ncbi:MAG: ribosome biogenesis GTPase Der [Acidobacteriota bacterium]|nr:ribosome biogenesis GTPase Der [Acidobacteriota bacterium]